MGMFGFCLVKLIFVRFFDLSTILSRCGKWLMNSASLSAFCIR